MQKPDHFTFNFGPSAVKVDGQVGSINGQAPADLNLPPGTSVHANVFQEEFVNAFGTAAQGDFAGIESIQPLVGNAGADIQTSNVVGQSFKDAIGFANTGPHANLFNLQQQTFNVVYPNGGVQRLSTVINQWSQMRNGSLTSGYPIVIAP
ncbi:MAG: hypothetical protein P4L87_11300 [Formivibrio sp.]|nr:hypothetical protein [Formivibrio sp.]